MLLLSLIIGCGGFVLSGHAFTRFADTKDARWATTGATEVLIASYFIVASLGAASS